MEVIFNLIFIIMFADFLIYFLKAILDKDLAEISPKELAQEIAGYYRNTPSISIYFLYILIKELIASVKNLKG